MEAPKAPTGVESWEGYPFLPLPSGGGGSAEKFWHVLRNGAFWCILDHVLDQMIIAHYDVHDISRGPIKITKITVSAMTIISTLKPAKIVCININCHGHSGKR